MSFPKSVQSLSKEEFSQFLQEMEKFEVPEEVEEEIDKHRKALQDDS